MDPIGFKQTTETEVDKTQPSITSVRYESPLELYTSMALLARLTQQRPREGETLLDFLYRLRGSTTPEEAVTFISFAATPKMAIWWGYDCLRRSAETFSPVDRALMEMIAIWLAYPDDANRHRTMQHALYAPVDSPSVNLGLAVGWSGGSIAPNDPAPVPEHRAPRAVNKAVLMSLARANLAQRSIWLARFLDQAVPIFARS